MDVGAVASGPSVTRPAAPGSRSDPRGLSRRRTVPGEGEVPRETRGHQCSLRPCPPPCPLLLSSPDQAWAVRLRGSLKVALPSREVSALGGGGSLDLGLRSSPPLAGQKYHHLPGSWP